MNNTEIAIKAREIYERKVKPNVEPAHVGEFLMLDIVSGGYEIGRDQIEVSLRAKEKYPDGIRVGMRIGYTTMGSAGRFLPAKRSLLREENNS